MPDPEADALQDHGKQNRRVHLRQHAAQTHACAEGGTERGRGDGKKKGRGRDKEGKRERERDKSGTAQKLSHADRRRGNKETEIARDKK